MSLWYCDIHGLTGPEVCCGKGSRVERVDLSDDLQRRFSGGVWCNFCGGGHAPSECPQGSHAHVAAASPVSESEPAADPKWPLCQCGHTAMDHAMRECVECDCITYDPAPAVSPSRGAPFLSDVMNGMTEHSKQSILRPGAPSPSGGVPSEEPSDDELRQLAVKGEQYKDSDQMMYAAFAYERISRLAAALLREREQSASRLADARKFAGALNHATAALTVERAARLVAETRVAKALAALDGEPPDEIVVMLRDQAMDLDRVPAATVAGDLRRAAACIEALAASPDSGDAT